MAQMFRAMVPSEAGCASSARVSSDTSAAAAASFDSGAADLAAAAAARCASALLLRTAALARPAPAWQGRRNGGRALRHQTRVQLMRCKTHLHLACSHTTTRRQRVPHRLRAGGGEEQERGAGRGAHVAAEGAESA
jgi:hypothetical protein